jgi:hypothetical protein
MWAGPPDAWLWALPLLAVALASGPTLASGFCQGHDWIFELVRTAQYRQALRAGQWPPVWASELYGGYGSPIFLFYAPLFPAASALAAALLGAVPTGCAAVLALLPAVAAAAVAAMVRQLPQAPPAAARGAVSFYVLHPYLLGDAWLRNANAEYLALCLAPLALAGVLRARSAPWSGALWIAAGLALVVLAHNLSGLWLAGGCAAATLLWLGRSGGGRRAVLAGVCGIGIGLALASFFWLPALLEVERVRTDELVSGKFAFARNFAGIAQLFGWDRFFGMGPLSALVLAALGASLLWGKRRAGGERPLALLVLGAALLCAALATRGSAALWELVPVLPLYQFPWRFAGPAALLAALGAALALSWAGGSLRPGLVLALELGFFALCAAQALPRLLERRPLAGATRAAVEAALAPAALLRAPLPATVGDEYLPRGAAPSAWQQRSARLGPLSDAGAARIEVIEDLGVVARLRAASERDTQLRWARWDFPHWQLRIDGAAAPLERTPAGTLASALPAGAPELELRYQAPRARWVGLWISALAALLWSGLALARLATRSRPPAPGSRA